VAGAAAGMPAVAGVAPLPAAGRVALVPAALVLGETAPAPPAAVGCAAAMAAVPPEPWLGRVGAFMLDAPGRPPVPLPIAVAEPPALARARASELAPATLAAGSDVPELPKLLLGCSAEHAASPITRNIRPRKRTAPRSHIQHPPMERLDWCASLGERLREILDRLESISI
jgi:hypothetical protein